MTDCCPGGNTPQPRREGSSLPPTTKVRVRDSYRRVGFVFYFYTQLRRYFTGRRLEAGLLGLQRLAFPGWELEEGLRCRVFRLARPRMWERMRFCLDKQGRYHPEWEVEFRKVRTEWRRKDLAVWQEPHPILASLRQKEQAGIR